MSAKIKSMEESIRNFAKQFSYIPEIINAHAFKNHGRFIIVGMGGSHLSADILKMARPEIPIYIHKDYGLPGFNTRELEKQTIILSSYSGNTEEVADSLTCALEKKLAVLIIAAGGTLLGRAKKYSLPYIQLPQTDIQPRMALGYSLRALLKAFGDEETLKKTEGLVETLHPDIFENGGKILAKKIQEKVPIIYSSGGNVAVALNWKIKFNETAKIPAFYNIFPELNHNEMTGFDTRESTRKLSEHFYFILLKDAGDHPQILKRMSVLEKLLKERGRPVEVLELAGDTIFKKIFTSLLLADWTAYYSARHYGIEPEQVPMVEEFKKLIK